MADTMAERFKAKRQGDYADVHEFFGHVMSVDRDANCVQRSGRVVIEFSDGSTYTLGNND